MGKRAILIFSLLLAAALLVGCASLGQTAADLVNAFSGNSHGGIVSGSGMRHFDDMEYVRPDLEVLQADAQKASEALGSGASYREAVSLLDKCYADYYSFNTMYALADIRSCQDLSDVSYADEYNWCSKNYARLQQIFDRLYYVCAASPLAEELEENYFWPGFAEQYSDEESSYFSDEAVALMQEESDLISEYRALSSNPTIRSGDDEAGLSESLAQLEGEEYDQALMSYYEKYNQSFADIYIRLVDVRNRLAAEQGFDSYEQMQYLYDMERDYSPQQAAGFMADVKKYMAPFYRELMASRPYDSLRYSSMDEDKLYSALSYAAEQMGGQPGEAFEFMGKYGLYDVSVSPEKADYSFQCYLDDYEAPFLFLNSYGDTADILSFAHEFGHYVDSYVNYNSYETIDVSEIFSQSMEYLTLSRLSGVLPGDEVEELNRMKLLDTLDLYVQQTSFAEFESRVYALGAEGLSAQVLNELSLELARDYGYFEEGYEDYYAMSWCDIPHFFIMPFYTISYPVSCDIAMQIYALEQERSGQGLDKLLEILPRDYAYLMEAVEYGGFESPFAPGRTEAVVEQIRRSFDAA